jgi:hypothetical protein
MRGNVNDVATAEDAGGAEAAHEYGVDREAHVVDDEHAAGTPAADSARQRVTTDEKQIMMQLLVLVFGSKYRDEVREAFGE